MTILDITILAFILLESSNVLALYFKPTLKQANAVGVFKEWENSKQTTETFRLMQYLAYWVAGSKLIFISLLLVIVLFADRTTKLAATTVLILSIATFYWKLYPLIRKMDLNNELLTKGYSRTLGMMIAVIMLVLGISLGFELIVSY